MKSGIILTDQRGHEQPRISAATSAGGSGSGIAAAQQSEMRGFITPLHKKQKWVLTGESGRTVRQKMRWLKANSWGACASRIASWQGPVRPDPDTGDAEYNKILRDFWQETQVDACNYDLSGKFTSESYQEMMEVNALIMGDGLSVFRWDENKWPSVRFYDALSVDNPNGGMNSETWVDGVLVNKDHKHLAYRLLADHKKGWSFRQLEAVVDARDCFFHAGFEHPADVRGVSPFLAAINPMIDMQEMDAAVLELVKVASLVGMSIESDGSASDGEPPALDGQYRFDTAGQTEPEDDTQPPVVPRMVEQVLGGPVLANPGPGKKINLLNVDRDVPSYDEIRGGTLEKISMALGLPVQMAFGLFTGRFNVTGPGIRLTIGDSHQWRNRRLSRRIPFVKVDYVRRIDHAIRTRLIPAPKRHVPRPYHCQARFSEAYTIDIGRDTQSDLAKLKVGAESLKRLAAGRGTDAVTIVNDRLDELEQMYNDGVKKRGLPIQVVFPDYKSAPPDKNDEDAAPDPKKAAA